MRNRLIRKTKYAFRTLATVFRLLVWPKALLLIDTPTHGNVGDAAIAWAERAFLDDFFPDRKVIEITSSQLRRCPYLLKCIRKSQVLLVHGGGFLGTIWPEEEGIIRKILKTCKHNRIIVFPQTIYYEDSEAGRSEFKEFEEICNSHPALTICLREKNSMEFFDKYLPKCSYCFIPDMATYLRVRESVEKTNKVLFCLRSDRERVLDSVTKDKIVEAIKTRLPDAEIESIDTVQAKRIYPEKRDEIVRGMIRQFAESRLIITDRLHGMIFAAHAGTPCIILDNSSHKVEGVYGYLDHIKYLVYWNQQDQIDEVISIVLNAESDLFDGAVFKKQFEQLAEIIRG